MLVRRGEMVVRRSEIAEALAAWEARGRAWRKAGRRRALLSAGGP